MGETTGTIELLKYYDGRWLTSVREEGTGADELLIVDPALQDSNEYDRVLFNLQQALVHRLRVTLVHDDDSGLVDGLIAYKDRNRP